MLLDHIAIIASSLESIEFYQSLGFVIKSIEDMGYDHLVYMSDGLTTLEIYVDPSHPKRVTKPEALGLRHLGFIVENIEKFGVEIKSDNRGRFCFLYDPDGLPIEIRERKPNKPEGDFEC